MAVKWPKKLEFHRQNYENREKCGLPGTFFNFQLTTYSLIAWNVQLATRNFQLATYLSTFNFQLSTRSL